MFKGFFIVCQTAAFESAGAVYVHHHLFLGRDGCCYGRYSPCIVKSREQIRILCLTTTEFNGRAREM